MQRPQTPLQIEEGVSGSMPVRSGELITVAGFGIAAPVELVAFLWIVSGTGGLAAGNASQASGARLLPSQARRGGT